VYIAEAVLEERTYIVEGTVGTVGSIMNFFNTVAGVPCMFAKGGEHRRKSIHIAFPSAFASRYASSEVRINIFLTLYLTLRG